MPTRIAVESGDVLTLARTSSFSTNECNGALARCIGKNAPIKLYLLPTRSPSRKTAWVDPLDPL